VRYALETDLEVIYSGNTLLNNSAFFADGNLITVVPTSNSISDLNLIMYNTNEETKGFSSYQLTVGGLNLDCSMADQDTLLSTKFIMEVNYQLEFDKLEKINYQIKFIKTKNPIIGITLLAVLMVCFVFFISLIVFIFKQFKKIRVLNGEYQKQVDK
jgi:hypothetical protein